MAKEPNTNFPYRVDRFVGCFDVLGFTKSVRRSLDDVIRRFEKLRKIVRQVAGSGMPTVSNSSGGEFQPTHFVIFSDTILIWSAGTSDEDVKNFLRCCCGLVAGSICVGLPLRGGIAYGDCHMEQPTASQWNGNQGGVPQDGMYVGLPIIDALAAEKSQEWIGVALHETCERHLDGKKYEDFIIPYKVPVKQGCMALRRTLWWPRHCEQDIKSQIIQLRSQALGNSTADEKTLSVQKKYEETLKFYADCRKKQVEQSLPPLSQFYCDFDDR